MFTMVFLGTLNSSLTICKYNSEGQFIGSPGCYNLVPTYDWIKRCIVSIFIVFFIGKALASSHACRSGLTRCLVLHSVLAPILAGVDGARCGICRDPVGQTIGLLVTGFRSLQYPNPISRGADGHDFWWSSLHRHRSWIRHDSHFIRDSVLAFRWAQHLPRDANTVSSALCHHEPLDSIHSLLLDIRLGLVPRSVCLQPSSVQFYRLHHRLSRVLALDVSWQ